MNILEKIRCYCVNIKVMGRISYKIYKHKLPFIAAGVFLVVGGLIFSISASDALAHNWLNCPPPTGQFYCACSGSNLECTYTAAPGSCTLNPNSSYDHTHLDDRQCTTGSITVIKSTAEPSSQSFNFSVPDIEHPGYIIQDYSFSLSDGGFRKIDNVMSPTTGSYSITENPPAGAALDSVSCKSDIYDPKGFSRSGDTITFNFQKREDVQCTFNNIACSSNAYQACYNDDVYWFDSCDQPESIAESCGTDGTTTGLSCDGSGNVQECTTTTTRGCSSATCTESSTTSCTVVESCTNGCSSGSCNPPPPTVTLSASPATINQGDGSVLTWTTTDADSCSWLSGEGVSGSANPAGGNLTVFPNSTSLYTIECLNTSGSASDTVTVTVNTCTAQTSTTCVGDDVYWVDSCGNTGSLKEDCGEDESSSTRSCSGGNVEICTTTIDRGCSGGSCFETSNTSCSISSCSYGCTSGTCDPAPPYETPSYDLECPFNSGCSLLDIWTTLCRRIILFATPLFVIMILFAAYNYLVGGAQPQRISTAKKTLLYGMIGYIILLVACFLPSLVATLL